MKCHEAAVLVLRETNNDAVMWGDNHLLDQIGVRAGLKPGKHFFADQVLNNLWKSPGILVKRYTRLHSGRLVRILRLPETKD